MSRPGPGFYSTIEYIGPRPQKPKRPNFFGGWVILLIAIGFGFWFGKPWFPSLIAAQDQASLEDAELLISSLEQAPEQSKKLAAAALKHSGEDVTYDSSYYRIPYPMGDIASNKGAAADVIIRSFREVGIDLQKKVHEDMVKHFRHYPQLWNAKGPDTSIDHRRIPNLQRFFERHGEGLSMSHNCSEYLAGDIVIWSMANADKHIGIIVPGPGVHMNEPWVVHNIGNGVKWENILFDYKIEGHFRYPAINLTK